jgi:hypothetical protein
MGSPLVTGPASERTAGPFLLVQWVPCRNAPADRPEEGKGIKGMIEQEVQSLAGAGVPSADRITLLRDSNGSGVATKTVFLKGLHTAQSRRHIFCFTDQS